MGRGRHCVIVIPSSSTLLYLLVTQSRAKRFFSAERRGIGKRCVCINQSKGELELHVYNISIQGCTKVDCNTLFLVHQHISLFLQRAICDHLALCWCYKTKEEATDSSSHIYSNKTKQHHGLSPIARNINFSCVCPHLCPQQIQKFSLSLSLILSLFFPFRQKEEPRQCVCEFYCCNLGVPISFWAARTWYSSYYFSNFVFEDSKSKKVMILCTKPKCNF